MEALSCDLCWLQDSLSCWLTLGEWYPAHLTARLTTECHFSAIKKKKNLIVAQKNVRLRLWGISHSQDVNTAAAKRARNLSLFMLMRLVGSAVNGESIGELEWHLGTTLGAVTISGCSFLVKKKNLFSRISVAGKGKSIFCYSGCTFWDF